MPSGTRPHVYSGTNVIFLPHINDHSSNPSCLPSPPQLSSCTTSLSPSVPYSITSTNSSSSSPSSSSPPPLNVARAFICDYPVRVLFDEGSQINMISRKLVRFLSLPTVKLTSQILIRGANSQLSLATHFVPKLHFRFLARTSRDTSFDLRFSCQPLITDSPFDLLLGISFIRHHNLVHHHCNHTIIHISPRGHYVTIPLLHSITTNSCRHSRCPFISLSPVLSSVLSDSSSSAKLSSSAPDTSVHAISSFTHIVTTPLSLPPLYICSPIQFLRHLHSDTVYYCLVLSSSLSSFSSESSDSSLSASVRDYVFSTYPSLFPDSLPLHPPPSDRPEHSIDLVSNYVIPKRKLYRQSLDELTETKKTNY